MKVVESICEVRSAVTAARGEGAGQVGLVPTMGALHEGHWSLLAAARAACDFVVVSIFVNPTQFGPAEDLAKYPRSLDADLAGCATHGADLAFTPGAGEMYPAGAAATVHVAGLTDGLCGAARPGHFDGVCTVVAKLFNIVRPDVAYFGAKDYQQVAVIRKMVADLDFALGVVVCPTIREADGLAMSSRNACLTSPERAEAPALHQGLQLGAGMIAAGCRDAPAVAAAIRRYLAEKAPSGVLEYVETVNPEAPTHVQKICESVVIALAVAFPSARLIDNIRVDLPPGRP